jgi:hypothetical protein
MTVQIIIGVLFLIGFISCIFGMCYVTYNVGIKKGINKGRDQILNENLIRVDSVRDKNALHYEAMEIAWRSSGYDI